MKSHGLLSFMNKYGQEILRTIVIVALALYDTIVRERRVGGREPHYRRLCMSNMYAKNEPTTIVNILTRQVINYHAAADFLSSSS